MLIESFKATLEEVTEADLLIHVVDLSHPRVDEHIEAVNAVTKEIGAFGKQTLIVFNKVDALSNPEIIASYKARFPRSVAISARTGEGVGDLVQALQDEISSWRLNLRFRVPITESWLIAEMHRLGRVHEIRYEGDVAVIVAHIPPQLEQKLAPFADK
jgi:GTP-binding protein HflX